MRRRAALRAPGLDRADRVLGEVAPVRASKLAEEGHDEAALARITTPIGLPEITGKDPATIARERGRRPAAALRTRVHPRDVIGIGAYRHRF